MVQKSAMKVFGGEELRCEIGETPRWHAKERALYWIDCHAPALVRHFFDSGKTERWRPPSRIGGLVLREGGGAVVALRSGVFSLSPDFETLQLIAPPPPDNGQFFLTEGRSDARGRFWVGLFNEKYKTQPSGPMLYRLDGNRLVEQQVAAGGSVANGLAWNRDGTLLYLADSIARTVWRFNFDQASGTISDKRVFIQFNDKDGFPDGAAVDVEDGYWVAMCGGGNVLRISPDGKIDRTVPCPSSKPTSVGFGGERLDRMYVTTVGDKTALPGYPESDNDGLLFEFDPGVRGVPEPSFRG